MRARPLSSSSSAACRAAAARAPVEQRALVDVLEDLVRRRLRRCRRRCRPGGSSGCTRARPRCLMALSMRASATRHAAVVERADRPSGARRRRRCRRRRARGALRRVAQLRFRQLARGQQRQRDDVGVMPPVLVQVPKRRPDLRLATADRALDSAGACRRLGAPPGLAGARLAAGALAEDRVGHLVARRVGRGRDALDLELELVDVRRPAQRLVVADQARAGTG